MGDRMLRWAWQLPVAVTLACVAILALGITPAAVPAVYLATVTPHLVRIDVREHRLPNRAVVPGVAAGLAASALSWLVTGGPPLVPLGAALVAGGGFFLLALWGGVGMGDAKLAAVIGLGSPTIGIAVGAPLTAFLLGGVAASIVLIRRGRGSQIAFGPWLLAGYWVVLVLALVAPGPAASAIAAAAGTSTGVP